MRPFRGAHDNQEQASKLCKSRLFARKKDVIRQVNEGQEDTHDWHVTWQLQRPSTPPINLPHGKTSFVTVRTHPCTHQPVMPPHKPPVPKAPEPTKIFFDPFNSSSTGHQRAENRLSGSTSWRDSRSYKLSHQFGDASGRGGQDHLSDLVGAGSEHFGKDGRKENGDWEPGASGLRENGWQDIRRLMNGTRKRSSDALGDDDVHAEQQRIKSETPQEGNADKGTEPPTACPQASNDSLEDPVIVSPASSEPAQPPQIFRGLKIYLNGSTAPLISDYKLKQLFAQHGGNPSISLGRRTVTHVIIGDGCGGGLASGKIEKEITTVGGKGIKFVTAQWVLDSIGKGIRQPEARYSPSNLRDKIGGRGQGSVRNLFGTKQR